MTYDQAIDYLYAKGYPQNVETYLNNQGTSPLGFRLGGTIAPTTPRRGIWPPSSAPPATRTSTWRPFPSTNGPSRGPA